MSIIVTGAAGFIGSNIVKALNARGITDIVAVDNLSNGQKFKNLADCDIAHYLDKHEFIRQVREHVFPFEAEAVFHEGACSDTMNHDGRYMMDNNYQYTLDLFDWCQDERTPFLYASSAAVYEQHKGRMASVAFHHFHQYRERGFVELFGSYDGYHAGGQSRDFVSVEDVAKVNLFFLDHPERSGIFNLGTGRSQSFNELAAATVNACRALEGKEALGLEDLVAQGLIRYTEFPDALKGRYQSFTQADISRLREAGYADEFLTVEEGVSRYVQWLAAR